MLARESKVVVVSKELASGLNKRLVRKSRRQKHIVKGNTHSRQQKIAQALVRVTRRIQVLLRKEEHRNIAALFHPYTKTPLLRT